jgi:hypothetical protein
VQNSEPEISLDQFNSQSHVDDLFELAEKQMRCLLGEGSTPAALENRSPHTPEFSECKHITHVGRMLWYIYTPQSSVSANTLYTLGVCCGISTHPRVR